MNIFDVYWKNKTKLQILEQIKGTRHNDDHVWKHIRNKLLESDKVGRVEVGDAGLKRLYIKIERKGKIFVFIFKLTNDGWKVVDECVAPKKNNSV